MCCAIAAAVQDESASDLEVRLGKALAISLQGREAAFKYLALENLVKLKIEPELSLKSEEQLPRSHFLICLYQTLLVLVHIFPFPSVTCRCWHTKRWLSSLLLEGKIEQCAIHHFFFHIRN